MNKITVSASFAGALALAACGQSGAADEAADGGAQIQELETQPTAGADQAGADDSAAEEAPLEAQVDQLEADADAADDANQVEPTADSEPETDSGE